MLTRHNQLLRANILLVSLLASTISTLTQAQAGWWDNLSSAAAELSRTAMATGRESLAWLQTSPSAQVALYTGAFAMGLYACCRSCRQTAANYDLLLGAYYDEQRRVTAALADGAVVDFRDDEYTHEFFYQFGGRTQYATALHYAAYSGNADIVAQLLAAGARVDAHDIYGRAPLYWAARRGFANVTAQLLAAGAQLNDCDDGRSNALLCAAAFLQLNVVRQLLAAGAQPNRGLAQKTRVSDDDNPLHLALRARPGSHESLPEHELRKSAVIQELYRAGTRDNYGWRDLANYVADPVLLNTPAEIRALSSGYHRQAWRVLSSATLTAYDLSRFDLDRCRFSIAPGELICPESDIVAEGVLQTTVAGELQLVAAEFSLLDLAIVSGRPELVDRLLMAGLRPDNITEQTRALLAQFPLPASSEHASGAVADTASAQIAQMLYDANLAHSAHVQRLIRGETGAMAFASEAVSPAVLRYAQAHKSFPVWQEQRDLASQREVVAQILGSDLDDIATSDLDDIADLDHGILDSDSD